MKSTLILTFFLVSSMMLGQNKELPKWEEGFLDIHFISTGRGSAAFYIFPDGTSLIIDVGDLPQNDTLRRAKPVPNKNKTSAEWIADYIYQFHPLKKEATLDYALITHYHDDHFGHFDNTVETHPVGNYKLSGITELGSIIPIKTLLDRGFDWPLDLKNPVVQKEMLINDRAKRFLDTIGEYWKFIEYQKSTNKMVNEKFEVGSSTQIKMNSMTDIDEKFLVRNLFANGNIASASGDSIVIRKYNKGETPGENCLCCGIKISYGNFDFYTGGDIPGINYNGGTDFNSMESLVAPVIGKVDVATMNHHGNRDSQNEYYIRTIQPRVWIGQSWSSNHPGDDVLRRITSNDIYPGDRDLFTNFFHQANKTVIGRRAESSYKSQEGHIVIRVYPEGENYDVIVLDDKTTEREIIAEYNYESR